MKIKTTVLQLTIPEAMAHNLLGCTCGHAHNNHFQKANTSCAHCDCEAFVMKPRAGKLIELTEET